MFSRVFFSQLSHIPGYQVARIDSAKCHLLTHSPSRAERVTDRQTDRQTHRQTDGKAISIAQCLLRNAR